MLWLGIASVIANIVGFVPYIKGILARHIKPQRITWGVWTVLTCIISFNQVQNGGGYSSYFFASTSLLVAIVFLLSVKYGTGGKGKLDFVSLIAALLLLVVWAFTSDTRTTTLIAITIDFVGAVPTVYKAYTQPETEAYFQWILAALAGVFSILAVNSGDYILFAYPVYIISMNSVIVSAKYFGSHKRK